MTTDPKKSLTPASVSDLAKNDIDQLLVPEKKPRSVSEIHFTGPAAWWTLSVRRTF